MGYNQRLVNKYFGSDIPSLAELEQRSCATFINSNPVLDYAAPLPENVIPVGGLHIKEANPLPKVNTSLKSSVQFEIIMNFV